MTRHYSTRDFFRNTPNALLARYFKARGVLQDFDFTAIKEAMEKSMAEGSQTFEQDLARLITQGAITREDGLAFADSPTNLMWRLQNDMTAQSRLIPKQEEVDDGASFTEITLDVREERNTGLGAL